MFSEKMSVLDNVRVLVFAFSSLLTCSLLIGEAVATDHLICFNDSGQTISYCCTYADCFGRLAGVSTLCQGDHYRSECCNAHVKYISCQEHRCLYCPVGFTPLECGLHFEATENLPLFCGWDCSTNEAMKMEGCNQEYICSCVDVFLTRDRECKFTDAECNCPNWRDYYDCMRSEADVCGSTELNDWLEYIEEGRDGVCSIVGATVAPATAIPSLSPTTTSPSVAPGFSASPTSTQPAGENASSSPVTTSPTSAAPGFSASPTPTQPAGEIASSSPVTTSPTSAAPAGENASSSPVTTSPSVAPGFSASPTPTQPAGENASSLPVTTSPTSAAPAGENASSSPVTTSPSAVPIGENASSSPVATSPSAAPSFSATPTPAQPTGEEPSVSPCTLEMTSGWMVLFATTLNVFIF